jgi:hypothetical protein
MELCPAHMHVLEVISHTQASRLLQPHVHFHSSHPAINLLTFYRVFRGCLLFFYPLISHNSNLSHLDMPSLGAWVAIAGLSSMASALMEFRAPPSNSKSLDFSNAATYTIGNILPVIWTEPLIGVAASLLLWRANATGDLIEPSEYLTRMKNTPLLTLAGARLADGIEQRVS